MAITIQDVVTHHRLVAAGSNEVWYEDIMAQGELIKLAASDGDIDTSDQLVMFELAQKVFIVNGAKKKVADFSNTKLTVSAFTNPPAHGDILVQGTAPNQAFLLVDYVNPAKTAVYGYAYYTGTTTQWTTGAFTSNNAIATMSPASRTVSAVAAGPHWYDWTPYPDIVLTASGATRSFGTMPEIAYLGCAYRGRAVLSGNPKEPFQWYMSRQLHPWDWAYFANDAGSPVAGGNSDAGQIGDIVRALVPYKDDYLIFGCASSTHMLAGDPASHGELRELSRTVGFFGAASYTWDSQQRLYFLGNTGLYRTSVPGSPVAISQAPLPSLMSETAVNQSSHRATMAYDSTRNGIELCITKLNDATSVNFWYDLKVEDDSTVGGYFPDVVPVECGAYAQYFYDAPNPDNRALLIGCADGYIRRFEDAAADDELHDGTAAIESYVTFGPYAMSDVEDYEGTLTGLNAVLAQSAASDSSDVDYEVYAANSSDSLLKQFASGVARITGMFKAAGRRRGTTRGQRVRGAYVGIRLKNYRVGETWGFEKLLLSMFRGGRLK